MTPSCGFVILFQAPALPILTNPALIPVLSRTHQVLLTLWLWHAVYSGSNVWCPSLEVLFHSCYWLAGVFVIDGGCSWLIEQGSKALQGFRMSMWPLKCPVLACRSILGNQCCIQTCTLNSSRGTCLKAVDRLFLGYFFTACRLFPMIRSQRSLMTQNRPGYRLALSPI